ncbi:hypothetical protein FRX31_031599 [Thalictrum thalictroides]|uniref:Uncharacterized protein n=1 Tax=Thalictrum thalictroides TaxID=46969 RepID=A0A7J6V1X5_THATH|nr:hypothetical protein FRX31_031599 [Thalictrum thalictroides]
MSTIFMTLKPKTWFFSLQKGLEESHYYKAHYSLQGILKWQLYLVEVHGFPSWEFDLKLSLDRLSETLCWRLNIVFQARFSLWVPEVQEYFLKIHCM